MVNHPNTIQQNNNYEMSELNEHINPVPRGEGNPNWQRLFDEAAETPPPRVWDAIERDLEREKDDRVIIVPFWGRSSTWAWGAAAAVALLLLGWWSGQTPVVNPGNQAASMATKLPKASPTRPLEPFTQQEATRPELVKVNTKTTDDGKTNPASDLAPSTQVLASRSAIHDQQNKRTTMAARQTKETLVVGQTTPSEQSANLSKQFSNSPTQPPTVASNQPGQNAVFGRTNQELKSDNLLPGKALEQAIATAPELAMMDSRPVQLPTLYGTQRIVWFRPTETSSVPTDTEVQKAKSEHWASVSVMPSSFNPGVGLQQASATYGNAFAQNSSAAYSKNPSLKSRADLSVAYQLSSGIQLSNRWSIETGLGYLEGRSTVNSPVQTIVSALAPNGRLSNLYADALNNSRVSADLGSNTATPPVGGGPMTGSGGPTGSYDATKSLLNVNVYDVARPQQLSNDYTFVQVPVQLGYQIRPRKRLGFTVLGGLLTNLFVRNTVNNQLSITNTDMVYRPITLSASTGLRFRYRPTRRWSASMAGIFQQALQRGTRVGADLTTRPQTMGVSVGLDYHF